MHVPIIVRSFYEGHNAGGGEEGCYKEQEGCQTAWTEKICLQVRKSTRDGQEPRAALGDSPMLADARLWGEAGRSAVAFGRGGIRGCSWLP